MGADVPGSLLGRVPPRRMGGAARGDAAQPSQRAKWAILNCLPGRPPTMRGRAARGRAGDQAYRHPPPPLTKRPAAAGAEDHRHALLDPDYGGWAGRRAGRPLLRATGSLPASPTAIPTLVGAIFDALELLPRVFTGRARLEVMAGLTRRRGRLCKSLDTPPPVFRHRMMLIAGYEIPAASSTTQSSHTVQPDQLRAAPRMLARRGPEELFRHAGPWHPRVSRDVEVKPTPSAHLTRCSWTWTRALTSPTASGWT